MSVHHDPISGVPIKIGEEYAQIDGLYFASLQTQQVYYSALDKGFEVKWVGGKPQLVQKKGTTVWELIGKDGQSHAKLRGSSHSGHATVSGLKAGTFTYHAATPELADTFQLRQNHVTSTIKVLGRDSSVIQSDMEVQITGARPEFEMNFTVPEHAAPATAIIQLESNSVIKRIMVTAKIVMQPKAEVREDLKKARSRAKAVVDKDKQEYIAELIKGARGVGMTLGWDAKRQGVIVKHIIPNGAAARTKVLRVGDMVMAIQGERIDGMRFKRVIRRLRNVPRNVVLVMSPAPPGWTLPKTSGTGRVRKLQAPKAPPRDRKTECTRKPDAKGPAPARPTRPSRPARPPRNEYSSSQPPPSKRSQEAAKVPPSRSTSRTAPVRPTRAGPPQAQRERTAPPRPPTRSLSSSRHGSSRVPPPSRRASPRAPPPPTRRDIKARVPSPKSSLQVEDPAPSPSIRNPALEKFYRMVKAGLPQGAILQAAGRDGIDLPTNFFDGVEASPSRSPRAPPRLVQNSNLPSPEPPVPSPRKASIVTTEGMDPQFTKYARMVKAGLPHGAIVQAASRDGVELPSGFFGDDDDSFVPASTSASSPRTRAPPPARPAMNGGLLGGIQGFNKNELGKAPPKNERAPPPASGNPLLAGITGFNRSGLKKAAPVEPKPAAPANPLLAGISGFKRGDLKSAARERPRSQSEAAQIAAKGKSGLSGAFGAAIDARRGFIAGDDSDESDDEEQA